MRILFIEPFEGGSHARFTRSLTRGIDADWQVMSLPGRHWKWRMRGSAPYFALEWQDQLERSYDLILASSYLPLAELVGLAPQLACTPKILYFHENQLAYPAREEHSGERDLHYGLTQMVSALSATRCLFNSRYNLASFIEAGNELLSRMPDAVPANWMARIAERSDVLAVPLDLPDFSEIVVELGLSASATPNELALGPVILWNHRWEHDKNPEAFFAALKQLAERNVAFRLIVCGRRYRRAPDVFEASREWLGERVLHWGYADDRAAYFELLGRAHVAISTAHHEFFGVSMLEATYAGAYPLVPNRLAYPEIYPETYRYNDDADLARVLARLCRDWSNGARQLRADRREIVRPYRAESLLRQYEQIFADVAGAAV